MLLHRACSTRNLRLTDSVPLAPDPGHCSDNLALPNPSLPSDSKQPSAILLQLTPKLIGPLAGWVFFALVLLTFAGDRVVNGKRAASYHQQLVQEFRAIAPIPDASVFAKSDDFSPWDSHKVLVGASYVTDKSYGEIQAFYRRKLESLGWHPVQVNPLRDWGRHFGEREMRYCKGGLSASLEYAGYPGENSKYGWTYALDLTWGLNPCDK